MRIPTTKASLAGATVLVVDDDDDLLELVSTMLSCRGAIVRCAHDATQAFSLLAREPFDVVVSDIEMPGLRGTDLIKQIRQSADKRLAAIPAIALTASSDPRSRTQALAAGYSRHLIKPVDAVQLSAEVALLCRSKDQN